MRLHLWISDHVLIQILHHTIRSMPWLVDLVCMVGSLCLLQICMVEVQGIGPAPPTGLALVA
jgi:hypothetical protein